MPAPLPSWSNFLRSRLSKATCVAAAFVVGCPVAASAHDPGLSSLDVRVSTGRVVATLSLAAADARLAERDSSGGLDAFVTHAIALWVDDLALTGVVERGIERDGGTSVSVSFEREAGTRLTIRSAVPARLGRGHRELLTVRRDSRPLIQRMLDAQVNSVEVDLGLEQPDERRTETFFGLGVSHILGGYDHLLFLTALLLGVRHFRSVVTIVTAFTVAHSLTLSLATLGLVRVADMFVEPLIAASIVYVGVENLVRKQIYSRWPLTFAFGLVHGFGFAGALQELGIGGGGAGVAVPLASFNAGVEAGQIAVASVLWPLVRYMNARPALRLSLAPAGSLLVVAAGTYWVVERTLL